MTEQERQAALDAPVKVSYRILPGGSEITFDNANDDYNGIAVFINGEYKTTFTGFLDIAHIETLLSGKAERIS